MRQTIAAILAGALALSAAQARAEDPAPSIVPVAPGETIKARVQSYLLSDPYYTQCLINTKDLEVTRKALDAATDRSTGALATAQAALTYCQDQINRDNTEVAKLTAQLQVLQDRQRDLKTQRDVAIAIAVALLVGSASATAVAIGVSN